MLTITSEIKSCLTLCFPLAGRESGPVEAGGSELVRGKGPGDEQAGHLPRVLRRRHQEVSHEEPHPPHRARPAPQSLNRQDALAKLFQSTYAPPFLY